MAGTLPLFFFIVMCAKPSEWITSVGTSHVGYSHGGREKRKKSYHTQHSGLIIIVAAPQAE